MSKERHNRIPVAGFQDSAGFLIVTASELWKVSWVLIPERISVLGFKTPRKRKQVQKRWGGGRSIGKNSVEMKREK